MSESKTFQIRIDPDLKAAWQACAKARGQSLADFLRDAVAFYDEKSPAPENWRFQNDEVERGKAQMKQFFNNLGLLND